MFPDASISGNHGRPPPVISVQAPFHLQIMVAISIYAISPLSPRYFCQYRLKAQDYTSTIRILPKTMAKCRSPHWKRHSELHFARRWCQQPKPNGLFGRTDPPFAISHGTLIPMGFSSTLDDALSQSVEHAINMITAMFEMPRQQVYLLLSAAIDFDVTQAVDITKGVHGLIDLSMFQQLPDYERTIRDIGNSRWTAMRRMSYWPSRLRQVTG